MKKLMIILLLALCTGCGMGKPEAKSDIYLPATDSPVVATSVHSMELATNPTQTPEAEFLTEKVKKIIDKMSIEDKIGQLFICRLPAGQVYEMNDETKDMIANYHLGGLILFGENIKSHEQVRQLIEDAQAETVKNSHKIPLFISVDEEGGAVSRLRVIQNDDPESAYELGQRGDPSLAYTRGERIGRRLRELGFTMDFAPVADIWSNPDNAVIGSRAFADDPETAGQMVAQFVSGLETQEILSVVKHFPGHGDTGEDSHQDMAYYRHELEWLRSHELIPFQKGIAAGAAAVMVGHISTPEITGNDEPALFSAFLLQDILRGEMGFDGLIITDGLEMRAITDFYDSGTAAVKAFHAGVDILLIPGNLDEAYNGIRLAFENGEISESRLNESVDRILRAKYKNNAGNESGK